MLPTFKVLVPLHHFEASHRDRLIRFLNLNVNFVAGLAAGFIHPNAISNGVPYHCAQIIAA